MNKETEHEKAETSEEAKETWAHDQQKHSYYYDDAHGYEIYNPDDEDDEDKVLSSEAE